MNALIGTCLFGLLLIIAGFIISKKNKSVAMMEYIGGVFFLICGIVGLIFAVPKKDFNVNQMKLLVRSEVNGLCFDVESNIPDNVEFLISLYKDDENNLLGQEKAKIKNGKLSVGPYRQGDYLYGKGHYIVNVTVPVIALQDESVRKVLGKKGEHLKGIGVEKNELGKFVEQKFNFDIDN